MTLVDDVVVKGGLPVAIEGVATSVGCWVGMQRSTVVEEQISLSNSED